MKKSFFVRKFVFTRRLSSLLRCTTKHITYRERPSILSSFTANVLAQQSFITAYYSTGTSRLYFWQRCLLSLNNWRASFHVTTLIRFSRCEKGIMATISQDQLMERILCLALLPVCMFSSFTGILGGSCDHYTHVKCTDFSNICGYDFHDHKGHNFTVARQAAGRYSTRLITKRAVDIVYAHDPEKVGLFATIFLLITFL